MTTRLLVAVPLLLFAVFHGSSAEMEWVRVSSDDKGFVLAESGKPFVPWGFNYDHESDGQLIEDYWDDKWPTVASAFQEMKELGANVVRIHLQFGKFMEGAIEPRKDALDQLARLVKLAEQTGLYLDLTGLGCYHKQDVPPWYDKLSERERWATQAIFWEAVAKTCSDSPAIFCYDLMNEPVVPGGTKKRDDWLGGAFAGKHFVQFIALETKGRARHEIAQQWIRTLVPAIRKHDQRHLVTVGLVPWSLDRPGLTSGFVPDKIAADLDFIAMHMYPEKGKVDEAIDTLKGFAAVGKPVVIEETFTLKCGAEELGQFIDKSQQFATGWIGFYWGKMPDEYRPPKTIGEALTLSWLELFQAKRGSILSAATNIAAPRTVEALWSDVDPRKEPLDAETVREWESESIKYRYVTFHIGDFKGESARMAAFYAFPQKLTKLPGLLHLHGGGQRAFLHEVEYYAKRGYACLSINWGGREMEDAKTDDPNTDWGAVDPTQQNVPGYFNLKPGDPYLDPFESPRNNNWYLLTVGARRGLTFLEQQPEVDADQLGVYGHSMGGNLTVYVAGTDNRVKVAAPSVGGQGFRTVPWKLLPEQKRRTPNGDMELFRATLGFQSYAPHIKAPLLWLGATNDFHGIMDDTYRTGDLIPGEVRYSLAPHLNHRFTPEFAVTRPLWIDQHLKDRFRLPDTPVSKLILDSDDAIPRLDVRPDLSMPVERVQILYSVDPDPQARFWRTAEATTVDNAWSAQLPLMSTDEPLFAFANVYYRLDKAEPVQFATPTSTFALSSRFHTATPKELRQAKVRSTDKPSLLIEDFASDWQDWYRLSPDNPHHWQYWTRKINDPKWRGHDGYQLSFDVKIEEPNELVVVLTKNFFRAYRGKQQDFVSPFVLKGGDDWKTVTLSPSDFVTLDQASPLQSWQHLDLFGFRAYYEQRNGGSKVGSDAWMGPQPQFRNLRWVVNDE
ncbi:MAG: hypothetical protein CMJ64_26445 [Planctomycetaceae bacterium]|nr:hypothetical protein [Planctomycetaceae bacterium]